MQGCSPEEANHIRRKIICGSWIILQRYLPSQKVLLSSSQMKPTFGQKYGEKKLKRQYEKKRLEVEGDSCHNSKKIKQKSLLKTGHCNLACHLKHYNLTSP